MNQGIDSSNTYLQWAIDTRDITGFIFLFEKITLFFVKNW